MKRLINSVLILSLCGSIALVSGCGGGGGGSKGGNGGASITSSTRTKITATISWGTRSRATNAPGSALSGVAILSGANPNGGDFVWTFNRDTNQPEAHTSTLTSPNEAKQGTFNLNLRFFSQEGGAGDVVATANKSVTVNSTGNIGDIAVSNAVASVEVAAGQTVAVGQQLNPSFVTRNAKGTQLAVGTGSGLITVISGQDKVSATGGVLKGVSAGVAEITIQVDGVTSPKQKIGIGQANMVLTNGGSKGYIPVSIAQTGQQTLFANVSSFAPFSFVTNWFAPAQFVAPDTYGDRKFQKWQLNNTDISTDRTLANFSAAEREAGTLSAIYVQRAPGPNGFMPNYYSSDFKRWASLPVKVYFHTETGMNAARQAAIRGAIDFWMAASGDRLSYQVTTNPAQAQITFKFGDTGVGVNGFCDSQWDGQGRLIRADITLSNNLTQNGQEASLALAARHEFGHALGMTGDHLHSQDSNDTMYAFGNPSVGIITERDINTLATMYQEELTKSRAESTSEAGPVAGQTRTICRDEVMH